MQVFVIFEPQVEMNDKYAVHVPSVFSRTLGSRYEPASPEAVSASVCHLNIALLLLPHVNLRS